MDNKVLDLPNKEVQGTHTPFNKPNAKLIGADGNVFNLMGICTRALNRAGYPDKAREMYDRITKGEGVTYYEALAIMQEYVEVE